MAEPIRVTRAELVAQRVAGEVDDHFCESLAEDLIGRYSSPGDIVLDPFAGNGTTLRVAARMGRRTFGVEIDPERAALARERAGPGAQVLVGDSRELIGTPTAPIRLVLTSPPYMTRAGHPENPLTGYRTLDGDYRRYLDEVTDVVLRLGRLLHSSGHLVLNVGDPVDVGGPTTPLVADLRGTLDDERTGLVLADEIPVLWDEPPVGVVGDTCLVYTPRSTC